MTLTTKEIIDNNILPIITKYAEDKNNTITYFIDAEGVSTTFGKNIAADALPISSEGQNFIHNAISNLNEKVNLTIARAESLDQADIRIMNHDSSLLGDNAAGVNSKAWTYFGSSTNPTKVTFKYNDVSINLKYGDEQTNSWKSTALHEFGHALGLEHPFEADDGDVYGTRSSTTSDQTLMAYGRSASGIEPTTYTILDIAALQGIWGEEINDSPKLVGEQYTFTAGMEDKDYLISTANLLQGFNDPDGDPLIINSVTTSVGTIVGTENGTYSYTPPENYFGLVTLNYNVSDRLGGVVQATNTLNLKAVNDVPAKSGIFTPLPPAQEDIPYLLTTAKLTEGFSDSDGDLLTVSQLICSRGSIQVNPNGTFILTPPKDFHGPINLTYKVNDGQGGLVATMKTLNVINRNDVPQRVGPLAQLRRGKEDTPYQLTNQQLIQGIADVDQNSLVVNNLKSNLGSFSKSAVNTWTFNPKKNVFGPVHFHYNVSDGLGGSINVSNNFILTNLPEPPITGTRRGDRLRGSGEDDIIFGYGGRDIIKGYGGDDILNAGRSGKKKPDKVAGGNGSDTFVIDPKGKVLIKDFDVAVDRIDMGLLEQDWTWTMTSKKTFIYDSDEDIVAILNKAPNLGKATII